MVKGLPTMRETRVQSLGQEDLLKKEMATHFSMLAWKNPWTEEPHRLQSIGLQRDMTERLHFRNQGSSYIWGGGEVAIIWKESKRHFLVLGLFYCLNQIFSWCG